jgi:hypothetical protein
MKFISARNAPIIRDQYDSTISISTADQNNEPLDFKELLNLDKNLEQMNMS